MSTPKKLNVAIITTDTLNRIGLGLIVAGISERFRIEHYDTFERYRSLGGEHHDIILIEDAIVALYGDFFRARKARIIPIIAHTSSADALPDDETGPYIYTRWTRETIESIVVEAIENHSNSIDSRGDKGLSTREIEVLTEVARGLTNKEIADTLNISMNTVMSHRKNITAKLNIKTVSGLTFYALMNGLISGEEVVEKATD